MVPEYLKCTSISTLPTGPLNSSLACPPPCCPGPLRTPRHVLACPSAPCPAPGTGLLPCAHTGVTVSRCAVGGSHNLSDRHSQKQSSWRGPIVCCWAQRCPPCPVRAACGIMEREHSKGCFLNSECCGRAGNAASRVGTGSCPSCSAPLPAPWESGRRTPEPEPLPAPGDLGEAPGFSSAQPVVAATYRMNQPVEDLPLSN